MSVYNVVILSILGVAITSVIQSHLDATFAITAVFIIFCTTLTLCFVFVPKVCQLHFLICIMDKNFMVKCSR